MKTLSYVQNWFIFKIKNGLWKKYTDGVEYVKFCNLYEKEYGIKLDINKPKKKLKNIFIIEDLTNGNWKIKNTNNIDENKTFTNINNGKNILLGKDHENKENKYLNIYEPFSCVIVGVQGSGKSYNK